MKINTHWQAPLPLEATALPTIPLEAFPPVLRKFISELSHGTETPPDLAAMMVLATAATAAQRNYRVKPKDGYYEPLCLWTCAALPSGSRKTTVQKQSCAPLNEWEKGQELELRPIIAEAESLRKTQTERIKALRAKAKKLEGGDYDEMAAEIAEMEANLTPIPTIPQLWSEDVTPENVAVLMKENDENMAILSDEGGIFETIAGRYANGVANLDIFLKGHAASAVRVNRMGRPSIRLDDPNLTLGLSVQPDIVKKMATKDGFRSCGLIARFLYVLPPSNLGYRTGNTKPMSVAVADEYSSAILAVLGHEKAQDEYGNSFRHVLRFDSGAYEAWDGHRAKIEIELREGGKYEHVPDWAGKLAGAIARIAGVLHVAEYSHGEPSQVAITASTMNNAIAVSEAIAAHTLAVFDMMQLDPETEGARRILRWIKRKRLMQFTQRECFEGNKSYFGKVDAMSKALMKLSDHDYILECDLDPVAHRPTTLFEVNPLIFESQKEQKGASATSANEPLVMKG
jgi:hypothetical protein